MFTPILSLWAVWKSCSQVCPYFLIYQIVDSASFLLVFVKLNIFSEKKSWTPCHVNIDISIIWWNIPLPCNWYRSCFAARTHNIHFMVHSPCYAWYRWLAFMLFRTSASYPSSSNIFTFNFCQKFPNINQNIYGIWFLFIRISNILNHFACKI